MCSILTQVNNTLILNYFHPCCKQNLTVLWYICNYWMWKMRFLFLDWPLDFWNAPSASEIQNGPVDPVASTSGSHGQMPVVQDRYRQGKLCFINPLFLQLEVSKVSSEGCVVVLAFSETIYLHLNFTQSFIGCQGRIKQDQWKPVENVLEFICEKVCKVLFSSWKVHCFQSYVHYKSSKSIFLYGYQYSYCSPYTSPNSFEKTLW